MVHYQDETNWHLLENKGLSFGKACKISIEGYRIGARNAQTHEKSFKG